MTCSDDSFKYTLHDHGESKEMVGNNRDVYIFLKDRMDLEIHKATKDIDAQIWNHMKWYIFFNAMLSSAVSFLTAMIMSDVFK